MRAMTALAVAVGAAFVTGEARAADSIDGSHAPGELIVKFEPGVSAAARADAVADQDARLKRSALAPRTALVRIPAGTEMDPAIRAFERDPRVVRAEPNAYREGGAVPNDPFFAEQWGLRNTAQAVEGAAGAAGADIHAPEAWERTTGSPDVKVAVVDSGINFHQPDLAPNVWRNPGESGGGREDNGVDDDGNGFVDDWRGWDFVQRDNDPSDNYGHGTHVAGTIAARGNNGLGVTGVAWQASLIPVRVLDNLDRGTCFELADGMAYAVRMGARIVNVSIGKDYPCQAELDVINSAPNTLFVTIAGNDGADDDQRPFYPCAYPAPNVVCVAASDSSDRLAGFSNYGAQSVDLAAPGRSVLSTFLEWGPVDEVYTDSFETPLGGRWLSGGTPNTWGRTPFVETRTGGFSLSNSLLGSYGNNTDNWAELTEGLDLSGRRDCAATVWVKKSLGAFDPGQPITAQDRLAVEASPDGAGWGRRWTAQFGTNAGFEKWLIDLSELEGRSAGRLRFRLVTNSTGTFDGVALDDLRVFCVPPLTHYTGAREEFAFDYGTSMAAPHVSGVAALVLSLEPQLTAAQLKGRIMSSVDSVPGMAGKTVTGGRLNAARALASPAASPQRAGAAPAAPSPPATGSVLAAQAKAVAKALRTVGIRALLRRGGLIGARLLAPGPGRLTLKLKSRGGTIAKGACSVQEAGRCPFDIRLTRRGRSVLRNARRLRVRLVLAFGPSSGTQPVVSRTSVTLRLAPSKSGQGGSK
jgi:subtilisin family serine protease